MTEVVCSKCRYCKQYDVLIGKPDWYCAKYKRHMSTFTIGCNFSCDGFKGFKEAND